MITFDQMCESLTRTDKALPLTKDVSDYSPNWRAICGCGNGVPKSEQAGNRQFIAHARTDIPALRRHIDRQVAEIARLKEELRRERFV